jgi:hypothetical protein
MGHFLPVLTYDLPDLLIRHARRDPLVRSLGDP